MFLSFLGYGHVYGHIQTTFKHYHADSTGVAEI